MTKRSSELNLNSDGGEEEIKSFTGVVGCEWRQENREFQVILTSKQVRGHPDLRETLFLKKRWGACLCILITNSDSGTLA